MRPCEVCLFLSIAALCAARGLCSEKDASRHASIPRDFAVEMQRYAEKRLALAEQAPDQSNQDVTKEQGQHHSDARREKAAAAAPWTLAADRQSVQLSSRRSVEAGAEVGRAVADASDGASAQLEALRRRGEGLRKAAAVAAFAEHRLNLTKATAGDDLSGAMEAGLDAEVVRSFRQAMGQVEASLLSAVTRAQNKATKFARQNTDATEHRTLNQLQVLLDESMQLLIDHQLEVAEIVRSMQSKMPVLANLPVSHLLLILDGSELSINRSALTSQATACSEWAKLAANSTPVLAEVNAMQEKLDSTSARLPALESLAPDGSEAVVLMEEMVNLGYMQAAATKDVVHGMVDKVGPVLADRLHCTPDASNAQLFDHLLMPFLAIAVAVRRALS